MSLGHIFVFLTLHISLLVRTHRHPKFLSALDSLPVGKRILLDQQQLIAVLAV